MAQRSAEAAKDITGLIKDSVEKIESGTAIADKSGDVLHNIVTSIKKVSDLDNEISAASAEQTSGISQINKAMNQLDAGSQSNAASSEEIASTAEEISSQSNQMQTLVQDLSSIVIGSESKGHPIASGSEPKARASSPLQSSKSKVVPFKKLPTKTKIPSPTEARNIQATTTIPFDEDEPRGKVGTTDGF